MYDPVPHRRMDQQVRQWIVDVLESHRPLVALALRQRAKFEGWLKFELAALAVSRGVESIELEAGYKSAGAANPRADLTFVYGGRRYDVELKTCNTNWRMDGVLELTRPITQNVAEVISDGRKLLQCPGDGIVAFCIFPVACGDKRWMHYLRRVGTELGLDLSSEQHSTLATIPLNAACQADIVVSAFAVPKPSAAQPIVSS